MKVSTGAGGWSLGLPAGDHVLIGGFSLFDEFAFSSADLSQGVGRSSALLSPAGRPAGLEFEGALLLLDEGGASVGVVLAAVDQVPAQHGEFAGGGHDRDLGPSPSLDPLIEGAPGHLVATQAASTSMPRACARPALVI